MKAFWERLFSNFTSGIIESAKTLSGLVSSIDNKRYNKCNYQYILKAFKFYSVKTVMDQSQPAGASSSQAHLLKLLSCYKGGLE